ncbi:gliding motility-associated lipoprotein GldD [Chitinophaga terrae (ex Kim and Jung 2007)]|jgi:gliding motility-associated lipoprotein GldD|uniref:Gliding motility-associated lipoprotein GldD n=1 Tax=Chitinophaga terrae (ex Kim and Jung 2007) TaxID=408074 RepID=A0A1H4G8D9_9BACT|nr:gliding motility lipoprotein GldD [Chitinophaga terrae (ex Kim and Jung 2007)]MDQ0105639.1 gliding motility-associated lipoprotein GldD [Chitinophaga terrae (ex Kim and Jung 2007)]GEP93117.1 gliding motility lipoprotein GldD [Chitinophaga terrae (ex Kim and Jung 2007)]SEB04962.1 gliding motility-associated lipoprotein GldD [Chitinophaga terrae (ex Kim and Jung 2007)]
MPNLNGKTLVVSVLLLLALVACDNVPTPKPRGYFKIRFPERKYKKFDMPDYPYTFEYPEYANIVKDTSFFGEAPENPYWINVDFPSLNGKIYMSYKIIGGKNTFSKLVDDAFKMTYKHTYKASYIDENAIHTNNNVMGTFYEVGGNAASSKQFFATDSTRHFLRGALYFDATPNADSLAPVSKFLEEDMWHLVETLQWR